jgi:hypothetical protein
LRRERRAIQVALELRHEHASVAMTELLGDHLRA